MSEGKTKSDKDAPLGCAVVLVILVIIGLIIWGISSCVGGDSSTPTAARSPTTSPPAAVATPASTIVRSDASDDVSAPTTSFVDTASVDFLAAVRAAGASGSDDALRTDGLVACAALRGDVDHSAMSAIEVSTEFTLDPYHFSQHAGDELVIDAVKFICPDLQSKIDNPTG